MEKDSVNNGGITEQQILVWKNKYRKVSEVTVEDNGEVFKGYFKRPDMDTLSAVSKLNKTDEIKAANVLYDNTWLGGSPELQEDAVLKMAAIGQLSNLITASNAKIKNV